MLKLEGRIFIRVPTEDRPQRRSLRPGVVLALDDQRCVVQLMEPMEGVDESVETFLHYDRDRKFVQQSVRVLRVDAGAPLVFAVRFQSEPISAELRQCYRVSCLGSNVRLSVADETNCEVVDVSATGVAFYGQGTYRIGQNLKVTLVHEGKIYNGHGTIQSIRRTKANKQRYGLHCVDKGTDTLARSLASINFAIQADQRRRLIRP